MVVEGIKKSGDHSKEMEDGFALAVFMVFVSAVNLYLVRANPGIPILELFAVQYGIPGPYNSFVVNHVRVHTSRG